MFSSRNNLRTTPQALHLTNNPPPKKTTPDRKNKNARRMPSARTLFNYPRAARANPQKKLASASWKRERICSSGGRHGGSAALQQPRQQEGEARSAPRRKLADAARPWHLRGTLPVLRRGNWSPRCTAGTAGEAAVISDSDSSAFLGPVRRGE